MYNIFTSSYALLFTSSYNSYAAYTAILFAIAMAGLIAGSYTDIKTREVPDWLSFSLIGSGIGLRLLFSIIYSDWGVILSGLIGFAVFFIFALLMFYTGQWGGGDSKVLMGMGALIGFELSLDSMLLSFIANTLLLGGAYGIFYSIYLALRNKKNFAVHFKKQCCSKKTGIFRTVSYIAAALLIIASMFLPSYFFSSQFLLQAAMIAMAAIIALSTWIYVFIKSVENSSMYKHVKPMQLTEGDWIANDITVGGKRICGPKDLGIEKKQIKKLISLYHKGKIRNVKIKEGIPFVPSFLLGFLAALIWGNLIIYFL